MIIKKIKNGADYVVSIPYVDFKYLKQINDYLNNDNYLNTIKYSIYNFLDKISYSKNSFYFSKIINNISIYVESINSSSIEGIEYNKNYDNRENDSKIESYKQYTNYILDNNLDLDNNTISSFHNFIEPNKGKGIRNNCSQFIGNYQAPNGKNILLALGNFWDIYYGKNNFNEIDILVRWSFQHLFFEMIHPFDDGNGRTGRMLNLLFFKYQEFNIFDNFILETSSNIFKTKDLYSDLLGKCVINIKNTPYNSDIEKSILRDSLFCKYMLDRLIEKINELNENISIYLELIETFYIFLKTNKVLKRYAEKIMSFFSHNIIFNRKEFKQVNNISEATTSKILKELTNLNLIGDFKAREIKNLKSKIFKPFYEITRLNQSTENISIYIEILNKSK